MHLSKCIDLHSCHVTADDVGSVCVWLQHSGHTFKPLDEVYEEHMSRINDEVTQLKRRHVELISIIQEMVSDMLHATLTHPLTPLNLVLVLLITHTHICIYFFLSFSFTLLQELIFIKSLIFTTRSIWKMLGPFASASRLTPIHQVLLAALSRAACASMSTTATTTTTRDGTAMAPWNGPNEVFILKAWYDLDCVKSAIKLQPTNHSLTDWLTDCWQD